MIVGGKSRGSFVAACRLVESRVFKADGDNRGIARKFTSPVSCYGQLIDTSSLDSIRGFNRSLVSTKDRLDPWVKAHTSEA